MIEEGKQREQVLLSLFYIKTTIFYKNAVCRKQLHFAKIFLKLASANFYQMFTFPFLSTLSRLKRKNGS